jgi:hypothetical protein
MDMQGNTVPVAGNPGEGFDVLDAVRDQPGYSPVCQVFSFDPADPLNPETSVKTINSATVQDTGMFVWCLQVTQ